MFSKFPVLRATRFSLSFVRHLGGLNELEKYERLRQLCCTSDTSKRKEDVEESLRPQTDTSVECCWKCPPMFEIKCKNAVLVGGASAIGFETAYNILLYEGQKVVLVDINQTSGIEAARKLCSIFGHDKACFVMSDLRQQSSIEMAFKEICKNIGEFDMYVNCVGVYNETPQCWDKMIRTNLIGCTRAMLLAYKYLCEIPRDECYEGSVIVNVSSYGSIINVPTMPMFSAASNGINGLTSSFGQDFHFCRSKVRCVTVCSACTDTGLLRNMEKLHYDHSWVSHSTSAMKCCAKQSPKVVGKAILTALKHGYNGSVYVIKEGKYYRYAMPDYSKFMRQETILL